MPARVVIVRIASNADMRPAQIRKFCILDDPCQALMKLVDRPGLSSGIEAITDLAETLQYGRMWV